MLQEVEKIWRATSVQSFEGKVASLNCMRHSVGNQWSCLRSSFEDSGDVRECLH